MSTHRRLGRLVLVVVEGPDRGKQHQIEVCRGRLVKAGRSATNELEIHDELVSGTHFELLVQEQGICLRDLGSRNGVYILGTRVREALLDIGAVFRVGSTSIKIVSTATISVPVSDNDHFGELYGDSPIMREAFAELERIAALAERLPVLITGETGTGKELVARGLHDASARAAGPFVVLDCTALPRELAESQILGHARGAFTGAVRDYAGLFEQAHGGTLFIDELGELPLELQAKLLRPIERGEVVRLGDATDAQGQRPRHRRDPPRPAPHDEPGQVPRGPLLSARVQGRGAPGAARSRRRHRAARAPLPEAACERDGLPPRELSPASLRRASPLFLARERPPAQGHPRMRRDDRDVPCHRARRAPSRRAWRASGRRPQPGVDAAVARGPGEGGV
jgi:pSer/pThr/pTyr-binding forkhead associated (FHA) protein